MEKKQFNILIGAVILSAIILSVGIALSSGIYRCEKIVWEGEDIIWFRLNKFNGKMAPFHWDRDKKVFMPPTLTAK